MSRSGSDTPHKKRRSEAFFGRRKSKMLSPRAANRFENLFPRLLLDPATPAPSDISDVFPDHPASVILEIGFGGGEHLIHQARLNPQNAYIGVEPFVNSMAKALRAIEDHAIGNIRLFNDDAVEILDWLPSSSIDRIDLLYPDPWPKSRHWKRRFVNTKNLDRFARVLRPNARFHFASDISTYINWTLQHCDNHPDFTWLAEHPDDWRLPFENWTQTRYEAKAIREGRTPCYLRFER